MSNETYLHWKFSHPSLPLRGSWGCSEEKMPDFIEVNQAASSSVIDGIIVPEKDGTFAIMATARHEANNHGTPTMRLEISINGNVDYKSKDLGWKDGPSAQQGVTTEFMLAGREYTIQAQSFNTNAEAAGIEMTAMRI